MKNNLSFERIADMDYQMTTDHGVVRVETILFHKHTKEKDIYHKARKITYQDKTKKGKIRFISLLTNDFQMSAEDIIAIYKRRWQIETLFKQIKQNFPLRCFYGESANAIKIQIWITLIANLLINLVKNKIKRPWSFSGLATMIRILLSRSLKTIFQHKACTVKLYADIKFLRGVTSYQHYRKYQRT